MKTTQTFPSKFILFYTPDPFIRLLLLALPHGCPASGEAVPKHVQHSSGLSKGWEFHL